MITLNHAIKISASRHDVYHALTDLTRMSAWHTGQVEGNIAEGKLLTLRPKKDSHFTWRTDKLEENVRIVQTSILETDSAAGKTLTFTLSDMPCGRTLVELSHGEWSPDDKHMPFCNTYWGEVLFRLKRFMETENGES